MTATAQWRPIHVGFAGSAPTIGNVAVWRHAWRPVGAEAVSLPDPNNAAETHRFDVYGAGDTGASVRFAAAQVADGMWAFYVPTEPPTVSSGESADGSLRYEHRIGTFVPRHFDVTPTAARLIDVRSGAQRADTSDWHLGAITPNADGSLFLRVEQNYDEALFRIDPVRRVFRDQGARGADRPLAELDAALRAARAETGRLPVYHRVAPDGSIRVDLVSVEWASSQWVNSPEVTDLTDGRVVLDLTDSDWDAVVSFPEGRRVRLDLRRFSLRGMVTAELDLARGTFRLSSGDEGDAPLARLPAALEAWSSQADRGSRGEPLRESPLAAWRQAVIILVGALVAVALATVLSVRLSTPASPPTLAAVPHLEVPPREPFDARIGAARRTAERQP